MRDATMKMHSSRVLSGLGFLKESKCFLLYLVFFFCYWFQVVIHTVANLHPSSDPFLGTSASSSEAPRFGTLQASSWDLNIVHECLSSMPSPILKEKEEKNPPRICGEGKKNQKAEAKNNKATARRERRHLSPCFFLLLRSNASGLAVR